jgi:hypothetical protein
MAAELSKETKRLIAAREFSTDNLKTTIHRKGAKVAKKSRD